jgi:hypothetical protein
VQDQIIHCCEWDVLGLEKFIINPLVQLEDSLGNEVAPRYVAEHIPSCAPPSVKFDCRILTLMGFPGEDSLPLILQLSLKHTGAVCESILNGQIPDELLVQLNKAYNTEIENFISKIEKSRLFIPSFHQSVSRLKESKSSAKGETLRERFCPRFRFTRSDWK